MKIDLASLSVIIAAFSPLLALIAALSYDLRERKRIEKPPQDQKLLRPPGYSLMIRLDNILESGLMNILFACVICAFAGFCAVIFSELLPRKVPLSWFIVIGTLLTMSAITGIGFALRAFYRLREARDIRLGLRGEQAVAEALQEVAESGFRSFHDYPGGEDWNIDHITVGTRGVFMIETKARRRRGARKGQREHVVIYDGETLQFPTGKDRDAIPQAKRNAKDLSDYLTKRTGELVKVEALVVLPGWFVENPREVFPVKVMNAAYLTKYLRGESEKIAAVQVRRIAAQLDEKCRDLEF